MHHTKQSRFGMRILIALATLVILVAGGIPAMAQEESEARKFTDPTDPGYEHPIANYDPWEGFNRSMYKFNYYFDSYVFLPVVKVYDFILPDLVQTGITNFFDNFFEVLNVGNNLLQGDAEGTFVSTARFAVNSTIGLGGLLDPATPMGFPENKEDFGQTLGVWGLGPGPYLVLPILGPSSVRDGIGTAVDTTARSIWMTTVVNAVFSDTGDRDKLYWSLNGLYTINTRAQIPFRYYETGSPFEYEYVRYIYLKDRQIKIED